MHAEQQVGVVGIDYLQLMVQEKRAENRAQELSRISATIKQLAMELDIPIICLAQLNRGIESRAGDPAPKLSDFKDSGSIEQDADVAVMLHRDEAFKEQVLGKSEAERSTRTFIRFGVEKNRNGATGRVMFEYVPHETKFLSLEAEIRSALKGKEAA
jgi:replicative DNA helicase